MLPHSFSLGHQLVSQVRRIGLELRLGSAGGVLGGGPGKLLLGGEWGELESVLCFIVTS